MLCRKSAAYHSLEIDWSAQGEHSEQLPWRNPVGKTRFEDLQRDPHPIPSKKWFAMKSYLHLIIVGLSVLIASSAWAHPGHDHGASRLNAIHGFQTGFVHPFTGADHLLAMVAVGILSIEVGGHARYFGPASFLVGTALGGILGSSYGSLPSPELLIALSVVAIGMALATKRTPPRAILYLVLAFFGACHGFPHGAEIANPSETMRYMSGFLCGSLILLCVGLVLALVLNRRPATWMNPLRFSGAAITAAGIIFAVNV